MYWCIFVLVPVSLSVRSDSYPSDITSCSSNRNSASLTLQLFLLQMLSDNGST